MTSQEKDIETVIPDLHDILGESSRRTRLFGTGAFHCALSRAAQGKRYPAELVPGENLVTVTNHPLPEAAFTELAEGGGGPAAMWRLGEAQRRST